LAQRYPAMLPFCRFCGSRIPEQYTYCLRCGRLRDTVQTNEIPSIPVSRKTARNSIIAAVVIGAGICLILAVEAYLWLIVDLLALGVVAFILVSILRNLDDPKKTLTGIGVLITSLFLFCVPIFLRGVAPLSQLNEQQWTAFGAGCWISAYAIFISGSVFLGSPSSGSSEDRFPSPTSWEAYGRQVAWEEARKREEYAQEKRDRKRSEEHW